MSCRGLIKTSVLVTRPPAVRQVAHVSSLEPVKFCLERALFLRELKRGLAGRAAKRCWLSPRVHMKVCPILDITVGGFT
jgi:hypothetical protein